MKQTPFLTEGASFEPSYRVAYLVAAYIHDTLTPAERAELDEWVGSSKENLLLFEELTDETNLHDSLEWFHRMDTEKARARVWQKINAAPVQPLWRRFLPYAVAASLILVAGLLYWVRLEPRKENTPTVAVSTPLKDIAPGSARAVLVLGDGRQLVLDSAANGNLEQQGAAQVTKTGDELAYQSTHASAEVVYNTIQVPRGGQYGLQLADGSRVWLNAASSLRFPTAFTGAERLVELTGEAYFEVAPQSDRPFKVQVNGTVVEVLGTHFNVMAYADEGSLETTLVEGKVKVQCGRQSSLLAPGQQAIVSHAGTIRVDKLADVAAAVAWHNGQFLFRDASIQEVGRQLARWYDLEVVYQDTIRHHFNAPIPRSLPLSKALRLLEGPNRVHFKLEGKKLIITR